MDDTPTPRKNRTALWIVLAVIAALLFACIAAAFAGAVGYAVGRGTARRAVSVPEVRVERVPLPEAAPMPELPGMASGWALVVDVTEDSPADRAGLRAGDLIVAVEGEPLSDDVTLSDLIQRHEPGDEIELTVLPDGPKRTVTVTLGRHPAGGDTPWMGITYRMMPEVPRMRYEVPPVRERLRPFSGGSQ
jgi:S1-C subfamily serine protease